MKLTLLVVLVGAVCPVFAAEHSQGRLLAQIRKGAHPSAVARAFSTHGVVEKQRITSIEVAVLQVPEQALSRVQEALSRTGLFNFVEPDGLARAGLTPNDPGLPNQWHINKIEATAAWGITRGSTSAPIAIVDSGVEPTHPDLASKLIPGWSFLTGTSNTADVLGHGTATAGSAAAATDNILGGAGVAWSNPIMPLVVLNSSNYASYSNIASAITYAADRGVRVINISIGGSSASSTLQSAVNYAWSKGAVVFASAMNTASSTPYYPAACDNVLAISATTSADALAGFSNYGNWIDFSAPGESIYTTGTGASYGYYSGTSFASPISAAVAALVLGVKPSLSNSALVALLQSNSDDLGTPGYDQYYGWGRVNAYKAVLAAAGTSTDATPPAVTISTPSAGSTVSGTIQVQGTATDNVGVTRIEFYIDGVLSSTTVTSPFAFPWDTTKVSNASYTLSVKAYDLAGNAGTASITVAVNNPVVADMQAPVVTVMSPSNGSKVGGNTKITVSAVDNVAVSQVSIYVDGVQVYSGSTAPYTYAWNTRKAASGSHVITAKAWDRSGNMGSSASISVTK